MTDEENLPEGWATAQFLSLIDYEGGAQPPKSTFVYEPRPGYVRLLQIRDFGDKPFPTYVADTGRLKKATSSDLLLARYGGGHADDTLGRICTGLEGAYNVALAKLVFDSEVVLPGFVRAFFLGSWFKEHVSRNSRSCQTGFNRDDLRDLQFSLPPLAEQRRIVAKVEALLTEVNTARDRLAKVPAILKRFRQSLLAAACSGRLTEEWRGASNCVETGEELLRRARGLRADGAGFQQTDSEPDIPGTWCLTSCGQLSSLVTSGSRGWAEYYAHDGPLFIRAQDINTDKLVLTDVAHVKPPAGAEGARTRVCVGDLLVTITGANVSKAALVTESVGDAYVSQHVALVRPLLQELAPWLHLWTISPAHGRAQLLEAAYGEGKPGLNLDNVRSMAVALPPVDEQCEIVRRVEALLRVADLIGQAVAQGTVRTQGITQAVLAKAFRGELVPTEAELARHEGRDYEPASVLLERIVRKQLHADGDGVRVSKRRQIASGRRSRGRSAPGVGSPAREE
jgi:type I restriction enzyme, S subunit